MQIHGYVSCKRAINNVYRNVQNYDATSYGDLAYWVYECSELIGFPLQYIPKVMGHNGDETYELSDYRIKLPSDFHRLIGVLVNGIMCLPATNLLHPLLDGSCCGFNTDTFPMENFYDNFGNTFSPQALPLNMDRQGDVQITFTMNSDYMTFNVREGKVCLIYYALPLDDEGFPLIPDDEKYIRAVSSYLQWKQDYILWRSGSLNDKIFMHSEEQKIWDLASAINHMKIPDPLQMENFKRQWLKMATRTEDFRTAFSNLSASGVRGRY